MCLSGSFGRRLSRWTGLIRQREEVNEVSTDGRDARATKVLVQSVAGDSRTLSRILRGVEDLYWTIEEIEHIGISQQFLEIAGAHSRCGHRQLHRFGLERAVTAVVKEEEGLILLPLHHEGPPLAE